MTHAAAAASFYVIQFAVATGVACSAAVRAPHIGVWGGGTEELPSIPAIINPKLIKKHTRLMIMPDAELSKIQDNMNKDKAKQRAAESKAAA